MCSSINICQMCLIAAVAGCFRNTHHARSKSIGHVWYNTHLCVADANRSALQRWWHATSIHNACIQCDIQRSTIPTRSMHTHSIGSSSRRPPARHGLCFQRHSKFAAHSMTTCQPVLDRANRLMSVSRLQSCALSCMPCGMCNALASIGMLQHLQVYIHYRMAANLCPDETAPAKHGSSQSNDDTKEHVVVLVAHDRKAMVLGRDWLSVQSSLVDGDHHRAHLRRQSFQACLCCCRCEAPDPIGPSAESATCKHSMQTLVAPIRAEQWPVLHSLYCTAGAL